MHIGAGPCIHMHSAQGQSYHLPPTPPHTHVLTSHAGLTNEQFNSLSCISILLKLNPSHFDNITASFLHIACLHTNYSSCCLDSVTARKSLLGPNCCWPRYSFPPDPASATNEISSMNLLYWALQRLATRHSRWLAAALSAFLRAVLRLS